MNVKANAIGLPVRSTANCEMKQDGQQQAEILR